MSMYTDYPLEAAIGDAILVAMEEGWEEAASLLMVPFWDYPHPDALVAVHCLAFADALIAGDDFDDIVNGWKTVADALDQVRSKLTTEFERRATSRRIYNRRK